VSAPAAAATLASVRQRIGERLAGVGRTTAILSGKGGVGKSAVTVNLALALARGGARVAILDADLQGPSVAKMLGLRGQPLRVAADGLRPAPGPCDLRVQSLDFFLQGAQALALEGDTGEGVPLRSALEEAVLADLLGETAWGELDHLLIDLPPGSERLPALARLVPDLGGGIAVTIPTEVALLAVERSIRRAHELALPLVGLVANMAGVVCSACGAESTLFQEAPAERLAREMDLPLLARIPFDARIAAAADAGRPFVELAGAASPAARAFDQLASRVACFDPQRAREGW